MSLNYSFERSQKVPAVAAAQIPITAIGVIIVFFSLMLVLCSAFYLTIMLTIAATSNAIIPPIRIPPVKQELIQMFQPLRSPRETPELL